MRTRHGRDQQPSSGRAETGNTETMKACSEPGGIEIQYQGSGHGQSESNALKRNTPEELTVTRSGRLCKPVTRIDI